MNIKLWHCVHQGDRPGDSFLLNLSCVHYTCYVAAVLESKTCCQTNKSYTHTQRLQ